MATQKKSQSLSHTTTDHEEIRKWAEARDAKPSCVKGTGDSEDVGLLRLNFPGYSGEDSLQEISWDEFFDKFDEQGLALVYEEETSEGKKSNFNKLVSRENAGDHGRKASGGSKKQSAQRHRGGH